MKLSELLIYDKVVIQCHDNPDPDAIASGYALYCYFKSKGKEVRLIYSGRLSITKPNIMLMIEALKIPIEHVQSLKVDGLIITVDCQYGAGNVSPIEARDVAIIDHHIQEVPMIEKQEIKNDLISASTLVWNMLREEGFDVNQHLSISTALYYGLFSDSSAFSEIYHPLDKDMRDSLKYDRELIHKLKNSIISLRELEIAGMALIRHSYNAANQCVMVKAQECDPNVLGVISDFALQVDCVNVAIVYNELKEGIKYSVRSCVKEIQANELAVYLSKDIGNGGGHKNRAAGFISHAKYNEKYQHLNADEYFLRKLTNYYQSFEIIDAAHLEEEDERFKPYKKMRSAVGYIKLSKLLPQNTTVTIRNQTKDIKLSVQPDHYLMIDAEGVTYVLEGEAFHSNYEPLEELFNAKMNYFPTLRIGESIDFISLRKYVKKCFPKGDSMVKAKMLEKTVKLFTKRDPEEYKVGKIGDYLVRCEEDGGDLYVISKEAFDAHYVAMA